MINRVIPTYLPALVSAIALSSFATTTAHAQIIWQPVNNISGNTSDFSLAGTYVDAASVGGGVVTVYNGSTAVGTENFKSLTFGTGTASDGADISFSDVHSGTGGDGYSPTGTSPGTLQDNYSAALNGVVYDGNDTGSDGGTVTLSNLSVGQLYEVEVWKGTGFRETAYTSGTNVAYLDGSDYVIGTFKATSDSISFNFAPDRRLGVGGTDGEVSGIALRELPTPTPEPSTYALVIGGAALLVALRRFKRA